jgi:hypothetical protein
MARNLYLSFTILSQPAGSIGRIGSDRVALRQLRHRFRRYLPFHAAMNPKYFPIRTGRSRFLG